MGHGRESRVDRERGQASLGARSAGFQPAPGEMDEMDEMDDLATSCRPPGYDPAGGTAPAFAVGARPLVSRLARFSRQASSRSASTGRFSRASMVMWSPGTMVTSTGAQVCPPQPRSVVRASAASSAKPSAARNRGDDAVIGPGLSRAARSRLLAGARRRVGLRLELAQEPLPFLGEAGGQILLPIPGHGDDRRRPWGRCPR